MVHAGRLHRRLFLNLSCWAFASTTVLESHLALETGVLYTLAVQELVSC